MFSTVAMTPQTHNVRAAPCLFLEQYPACPPPQRFLFFNLLTPLLQLLQDIWPHNEGIYRLYFFGVFWMSKLFLAQLDQYLSFACLCKWP